MKALFSIILISTFMVSCTSVKEYQKMYLNDADMELSQRQVEQLESFGETFREGASGAVSGQTGGGCGCY